MRTPPPAPPRPLKWSGLASIPKRSAARAGFGLLELLTTLALLVIVLGLMVSLARFVRATSAERITRGLLNRARDALAAAPAGNAFPDLSVAVASAPVPPAGADEAAWSAYARRTGPTVRRLLGPADATNATDTDAWGTPLCYVPRSRPDVGMAPGDHPFCLSAGPDGRYLTRDDNLYSYDEMPAVPATAPTPALRQPPGGGHGE